MILTVRLLLLTGCRLSEILTLRWEHVDIESKCLRLPDSKTGAKVVYLSAPALQLLAAADRSKGGPWVVHERDPTAHWVNAQKPWRRIRSAADLADVRLHDLRHSYASVGASLELSLPLIGKLLGHTQAKTTSRYSHLHDNPIRHAAERVGSIIGAALSNDPQSAEITPLSDARQGRSRRGG